MFVFIISRSNDTHVVDWKNIQGKYRTLCGKFLFQRQNIITLGADNTFPGICLTCKRYYDEMYSVDLENDIRMLRSSIRDHSSLPIFHRYNFRGPKAEYESTLRGGRSWNKLNIAKSFIKNKNNKYYVK